MLGTPHKVVLSVDIFAHRAGLVSAGDTYPSVFGNFLALFLC